LYFWFVCCCFRCVPAWSDSFIPIESKKSVEIASQLNLLTKPTRGKSINGFVLSNAISSAAAADWIDQLNWGESRTINCQSQMARVNQLPFTRALIRAISCFNKKK